LRLYKPGLVWPLEPEGARAFVRGLRTVLVVEERRDLVESQLKQVCYGFAERPTILGKRDAEGRPLIKDVGELTAEDIARAIYDLVPEGERTPLMRDRMAALTRRAPPPASLHERAPFFCSGCPHNTSTVVPSGSRAMAGIGCHYMAQTMPRNTLGFTQMGGEGVLWVGQAPFTDERHVFVNLGDGTYFHSGILAIRQAVAAGVNITYKILYNDAVAMTGGQAVDGALTVAILARQVAAEGVGEIVVVSDDVARTRAAGGLAADIEVLDRDQLDAVQRRLRERQGVSVLVYDQTCATELRRRRKRGLAADPGVRMFINPRVCEGCGDCSAQSNCVSIEPLDTAFGRKRRIDQSSCNSDLSCRKGFCPSFVTVRGATRRRPRGGLDPMIADLPAPAPLRLELQPFNIVLAGVGGQGVTSLSAILGMAAHIDGLAVRSVDMLGMAQKGGGVFAHLRLARGAGTLMRPRIGQAQADLLLANDMVVAHTTGVAAVLNAERTAVILNGALSATSEFTVRGDLAYDRAGMIARLRARAKTWGDLDAGRLAVEHLGDAIFANMLLLGHAWQRGLVPLSLEALDKAITLNGAAVDQNRRAFAVGRLTADRPEVFAPPPAESEAPQVVIQRLRDDLVGYQDRTYADRFTDAIAAIAAAEAALGRWQGSLTLAAARSLHKLMAYKDEYEVARLYADPEFARAVAAEFGPGARLSLNLAPPILGRVDAAGHPRKQEFGPWMLRLMPLLARFKPVRGRWCDPFGRTAERRAEREVRDQFFEVLGEVVAHAETAEPDVLLELAKLPQSLRGYGHVKAASLEAYRRRLTDLRRRLSDRVQVSLPAPPIRERIDA
ncbi:MAG: indolepyruvate ferredoxin oxidoreductase family protein, partial [Proteobacteria bacterium]|nr:indolepyruvate ferredoxin oxidoreductase family protein [Pseudomonadota bacterium]